MTYYLEKIVLPFTLLPKREWINIVDTGREWMWGDDYCECYYHYYFFHHRGYKKGMDVGDDYQPRRMSQPIPTLSASYYTTLIPYHTCHTCIILYIRAR